MAPAPDPFDPLARPPALRVLSDGTIKQVNPFTGDLVWTVPGRADRPLSSPPATAHQLAPDANATTCTFCTAMYLHTPPEKVRSVRKGTAYERFTGLTPGEVNAQIADFRRIPNLFEIISVDYWRANYGFTMGPTARQRWEAYVASPGGREHLLAMARARLGARAHTVDDDRLLQESRSFFVGTHDVIVGRRHYIDGARTDADVASSGSLTPAEHREFIALTADALGDLYAANSDVRYVSAFQNWLHAAGASFDHLHKQVVGIDEHGTRLQFALRAAREHPDVWNQRILAPAIDHGLLVAENDHAVAIAGVGHRYPSLEVWSLSATREPWLMATEARDGFADLVHALHVATGADVPSNEEWHHTPPDVDVFMPWHVLLKWRVSTLAGFEGGTKIYTNTIGPWDVRRRVVEALLQARAAGRVADQLRIGTEMLTSIGALPSSALARH